MIDLERQIAQEKLDAARGPPREDLLTLYKETRVQLGQTRCRVRDLERRLGDLELVAEEHRQDRQKRQQQELQQQQQ